MRKCRVSTDSCSVGKSQFARAVCRRENREYRDKDYVADIITFAIFADTPVEERIVFDGEINLGEIILALDKITQSAKEKGVTKEEELCFLLAHGIMHLLGYDHQTEEDYNFVVEAQKMALNKIKDKNV